MSELMKKYWFVVLVGALLIATFGFVMLEENKDRVAGKKEDGKNVVFEIGEDVITAEELNEMLMEDQDSYIELVAYNFQTDVLLQAVEITNEMRTEAKELISTMLNYFKESYSDNYESALAQWMSANGFTKESEIVNYTLPWMVIRPMVMDEYLEANLDTFYDDYAKEYQPRLISHILVSMEDPNSPTEEELAKVAEIEKELETKSFSDVATGYSDDTGSATSGGSIGIVDSKNASDFVSEFASAAMQLSTGETSQWVKTTFGWHLIKCDGSDRDSLIESDALLTRLSDLGIANISTVLVEKAEEIGFSFADEELQTKVINYLLGNNTTDESEGE
ncbi:MAG: peptidylprolyl isomerase [Erysipelotrichaceae bacterium]